MSTVHLIRDKGNLHSIRAMLFAVAMFAVMDLCLKLLAASYPAMQVAALRALCSLPLIAAYVAWRGALRGMFRVRYRLHLLRAAVGIASLALFAYGLRQLSMAEAYTIFFAAPGLITVMSVLVLGERVNFARWMAIVVGLVGVLIVLRPSAEGFLTLGGLAVLGAAAAYAVSNVTGRVIARTERGEHMVLWLMFLTAVGATAMALPGWVPVRSEHAWYLAGLAVFGFVAQVALTEAFAHGEASVVAPFEYTALAWGVAIDVALWGMLPDRYTLLGAAIIIGSGVYLIRHETRADGADHP